MARTLTARDKKTIQILATSSKNAADAPTAEYEFRLRSSDDEATITLIGHLVVENLINRIIQAKCKSPKTILDDVRSYPFSVKLQIIYSMGLLPDDYYKNIIRINKFRNKFAHNIDFIVEPSAMIIDIGNKSHIFPDEMSARKIKKSETKMYFKFLCGHVIHDLSNYMNDVIKVDPRLVIIK